MAKKIVSGNDAVGLGALRAGVKVVSGYPGTPSSEVIIGLLKRKDLDGTYVEWSVNEKVALEVAAGAAWAGKRSLVTMKMSGLNVAFDALASIAYSGCKGGMVIYVCDDPGVSAGMPEQDVRGFAQMADMPMLEPATVQESYDMTILAFELSEKIGGPVFVRSVTNVSQTHSQLEYEERTLPNEAEIVLEKDINKFTKAGAAICMEQHRAVIERLAAAEDYLDSQYNDFKLGEKGGLGIITAGVAGVYLAEALSLVADFGVKRESLTVLNTVATIPAPVKQIKEVIANCSQTLVLEELEPYLERTVLQTAYQMGKILPILGKLDGTYSRINCYDAFTVVKGLEKALNLALPENFYTAASCVSLAAPRPITTCAGCPHRGTYLAVNQAIRKAGYKKDEVMVTGDIGCTILGMNPPFYSIWTEVSMGTSIPLAQGFVKAGLKTPVIATIGDSTFFHGGMPGLVNAIQHNIPVTVIIMDNGWTAMTGMQVNPNTAQEFQGEDWKQLDLETIIPALGVDQFFVVDPYQLTEMTDILTDCMQKPGVKVILARRECAIQTNRRKIKYGKMTVDAEKCTGCKACVSVTGCPALSIVDGNIEIDQNLCNGCGLCTYSCKFSALVREDC